jgi:recombinational DNA repair ATPase RecF
LSKEIDENVERRKYFSWAVIQLQRVYLHSFQHFPRSLRGMQTSTEKEDKDKARTGFSLSFA